MTKSSLVNLWRFCVRHKPQGRFPTSLFCRNVENFQEFNSSETQIQRPLKGCRVLGHIRSVPRPWRDDRASVSVWCHWCGIRKTRCPVGSVGPLRASHQQCKCRSRLRHFQCTPCCARGQSVAVAPHEKCHIRHVISGYWIGSNLEGVP